MARNKWKEVQDINKTNKIHLPTKITNSNRWITHPKEIAEIAYHYFVEKIRKIREKNFPPRVDPLDVLDELIPKVSADFKFSKITVKQTIEIIKKIYLTLIVGDMMILLTVY